MTSRGARPPHIVKDEIAAATVFLSRAAEAIWKNNNISTLSLQRLNEIFDPRKEFFRATVKSAATRDLCRATLDQLAKKAHSIVTLENFNKALTEAADISRTNKAGAAPSSSLQTYAATTPVSTSRAALSTMHFEAMTVMQISTIAFVAGLALVWCVRRRHRDHRRLSANDAPTLPKYGSTVDDCTKEEC
ncbi:unnamed protein product [Amoebophrya sp. A25]|nr:unnamed protein product [Amoebophrya sp. A25]CAD7959569.1 unnamed protein product [Amoebophrya sp. A25]CAD7977033.1 unnamed protein product [Amoebophrya sp. A25]|eukprot:GSA25T00027872001.1